jgi:hypothetical protein
MGMDSNMLNIPHDKAPLHVILQAHHLKHFFLVLGIFAYGLTEYL